MRAETSRAMVLHRPGTPLRLEQVRPPSPDPDQVLLRVHACGICRTDLHIVDGELTDSKLPLIPGHMIVGEVVEAGSSVAQLGVGDRVGVPWLGSTDGDCKYCRSGRENLCDRALFTGYQIDGGYADYAVADSRYCLPIPEGYHDLQAAPLLCAGLIGYRCLRMAGDAPRLGFYGFGSAAHILIQVAQHRGQRVYAFTRRGDNAAQNFATELGADWVGDSDTAPPEPLDAAIIFAPAGELVPAALRAVGKGGSSAVGSTCPTSRAFLTRSSGASARCDRWPTSHAPTARNSCAWRRPSPSTRRCTSINSSRPMKHSMTSARVGFAAALSCLWFRRQSMVR